MSTGREYRIYVARERKAQGGYRYDCYPYSLNAQYTTLANVLEHIQSKIDNTLVFRRSCFHGSCGTCGVMLNGAKVLACLVRMQDLTEHELYIDPLSAFPAIKDIAVDLSKMYAQFPQRRRYVRNIRQDTATTSAVGHTATTSTVEHTATTSTVGHTTTTSAVGHTTTTSAVEHTTTTSAVEHTTTTSAVGHTTTTSAVGHTNMPEHTNTHAHTAAHADAHVRNTSNDTGVTDPTSTDGATRMPTDAAHKASVAAPISTDGATHIPTDATHKASVAAPTNANGATANSTPGISNTQVPPHAPHASVHIAQNSKDTSYPVRVVPQQLEHCIECGLCETACPITAPFLGAAALAAHYRESINTPQRKDEILTRVSKKDGVAACKSNYACSKVCPAGVYPSGKIMKLRQELAVRDQKKKEADVDNNGAHAD